MNRDTKSLSRVLSCIIAALVLGAVSGDSSLYAQRSKGISGLSDNEEYMELIRHNAELSDGIDSLTDVMNDVRNSLRYRIESDIERSPAERDSISKLIIDLEQRIFDLRDERGIVTNRINSMEQEWVLVQFNNPAAAPTADFWAMFEEAEESAIERSNKRNLIDNDSFVDELPVSDYAMLRRAHAAESEIREKIEEYMARYEILRTLSEEYMAVDNQIAADSIFNEFDIVKRQNETMENYIETLWREIIDTKQYSYSYVLEKHKEYDLLDNITDEFIDMHRDCKEYIDYYASNAIMHYAVGHPRLLNSELNIANAMGYSEAADSLNMVRNTVSMPEYRIDALNLEERLFLDFEPIVFDKVTYYNNSNPIPQLKVYDRGTIYRILLGRFRSMQNLSIFKGVRPLFIIREGDYYHYYAGGYATLAEADEAALMLRNKGFKAPQVCRWENGEMTNITKEAENAPKDKTAVEEPVSNVRYIVEIEADTLESDVRTTIEATTPGKRITRAGNKFVVGTFVQRSDADVLVDALKAMFEDMNVSARELVIG